MRIEISFVSSSLAHQVTGISMSRLSKLFNTPDHSSLNRLVYNAFSNTCYTEAGVKAC